MAQEFLNGPQITAALKHVRRHGSSECVRVDVINSGSVRKAVEDAADRPGPVRTRWQNFETWDVGQEPIELTPCNLLRNSL